MPIDDWGQLPPVMDLPLYTTVSRTELPDLGTAYHLFNSAVVLDQIMRYKLRANAQPVAVIKAVHTGPGASKAPSDDAGGLEPVICHK